MLVESDKLNRVMVVSVISKPLTVMKRIIAVCERLIYAI